MVASSLGPMFINVVDASEVLTKDVEYTASIFFKAIEDIGDEKVVQVITDNGANFKAAGALIEDKYPHIFWTLCIVHCLNLALKAICEPSEKAAHYIECKWVQELVSQVNDVNNFITNHGLSKAIFNRYSTVKLLKFAETRFASHIVMAARLRRLKEPLEKMVMDVDWKFFRVTGKTPTEIKARDTKDLIVSDGWWEKVDYFLSFTEPMVKFLRVGDMDSCVLAFMYDMSDSTIEEVKRIIFEQEDQNLQEGNSSFFNAIHGAKNGVRRVAPNEDEEVSLNRDKCLQRIFAKPEDLSKVYKDYGAFARGDAFDGDSLLEHAELSLNKPEIEAMTFELQD
ncbi:uncharacterized protein LOC104887046 [Beta vulgaris subsp. vulgaris]|uniref:uncharacterized protein LOC104887046 n=1 Tax=Beta vulgaris subsp. vulgaris TaxID=3555 RepID=UPI00053F7675|nr:uncharacterized protein LOC104887046 [Beta vulgaris subsp. vulgaris]